MDEYKVQITETLQRIVTILADNSQDAIDDIKEQYHYEGIVLDGNDMKGDVEIEVIK